jgi:hypothetical protein
MARLRFLYVIHTTADVTDADTDGNFELVVFSPVNPQAEIGEFGFPDRPHDERERGRTDRYRLNVSSLNMDMFHVRPEILAIRTGSDDAWLPSSIWVIAEDVQGNRQLEVALPNWPSSLWWSTQESEGEPIRRLVVPLTQ